jgi:hypothetical protein
LDGDGVTLRWLAVVSRPTVSGECCRGKGSSKEGKWEWRTLPLGAGAWIRPLTHVGRSRPTVTGAGALSVMSAITAW